MAPGAGIDDRRRSRWHAGLATARLKLADYEGSAREVDRALALEGLSVASSRGGWPRVSPVRSRARPGTGSVGARASPPRRSTDASPPFRRAVQPPLRVRVLQLRPALGALRDRHQPEPRGARRGTGADGGGLRRRRRHRGRRGHPPAGATTRGSPSPRRRTPTLRDHRVRARAARGLSPRARRVGRGREDRPAPGAPLRRGGRPLPLGRLPGDRGDAPPAPRERPRARRRARATARSVFPAGVAQNQAWCAGGLVALDLLRGAPDPGAGRGRAGGPRGAALVRRAHLPERCPRRGVARPGRLRARAQRRARGGRDRPRPAAGGLLRRAPAPGCADTLRALSAPGDAEARRALGDTARALRRLARLQSVARPAADLAASHVHAAAGRVSRAARAARRAAAQAHRLGLAPVELAAQRTLSSLLPPGEGRAAAEVAALVAGRQGSGGRRS